MSANKNAAVNLSQLILTIPVRRKLVDADQRDKFEWNQWQSATKVINNVEVPTKEKHVRNLILGTVRLEGSRLFWSMIVRIRVESHPVTCWKFCYVIHRLLRDGHQHVVSDSVLLSPYFSQLCKYLSGLQQNYGPLTYRYCHLIAWKLKFHERNPVFAGNLTINKENNNNIQSLFNDNWNSYLQLSIELFDYMEELLNLVQVIFTSLDQSRSNSMTTVGQCRLNPLVICIQDSSVLYDHIVKILFKLHEGVPNETLQDHRQRLVDQFRRLKRFYVQSSTLQYFKNLIQVPNLSDNPPNFNIGEGLKNYQTAVAVVNTSSTDSSQMTNDFLIDLSDNNKSTIRTTMSDDLSANESMFTRSKDISDLEQRLMQYDTMLQQNRSETDDLHRTIAARDAELIAEKNHRLQIEEQLRQQLENQKRFEDMQTIDHKTNADEKFEKLREEHLTILRQDSEKQKQFTELNQQFLQLKEDLKKKENDFQQNSSKLQAEILDLRQTNDELQDRIQVLTTERNDYQTISKTTGERMKEIQHEKQTVEERLNLLKNDKTQLDNEKFLAEKQLKEMEGARRNLFDKNREHQEDLLDLVHEKEILEHKIFDLEQTAREWAQKFVDATDKQKLIQTNHENLLNNIKRQYKHSILTHCINQMYDGIDRKNEMKLSNGIEYFRSKLEATISSTRKIQDLWKQQNDSDESTTFSFLNECITLANCMTEIVVYGKTISNLTDDCRDVTNRCIDLLTNYQTESTPNDLDKTSNDLIHRLNSLIAKAKTN